MKKTCRGGGLSSTCRRKPRFNCIFHDSLHVFCYSQTLLLLATKNALNPHTSLQNEMFNINYAIDDHAADLKKAHLFIGRRWSRYLQCAFTFSWQTTVFLLQYQLKVLQFDFYLWQKIIFFILLPSYWNLKHPRL